MSPTFVPIAIKLILPFSTWWVGRQEERILREGVELSAEEKNWAREVGVRDVERVRLLFVNPVPLPGSPLVNHFAGWFKYPLAPIGLAARYGIYLDLGSKNDPSLLVHELVHTAQYEQLGGIGAFLKQYFDECLRDGYTYSAMEEAAREAAAPFNRPPDW